MSRQLTPIAVDTTSDRNCTNQPGESLDMNFIGVVEVIHDPIHLN